MAGETSQAAYCRDHGQGILACIKDRLTNSFPKGTAIACARLQAGHTAFTAPDP